MDFLQIFMTPFSWLMKVLYTLLFENYGLALIVFALIVKVILFPFSLKGKKSMIQTTMLQGKMNQLQKQYGKDKNRYNEELQKLYAKENINPMGGCIWSMLPMLVLFPLYAVVRRPLRYLCGLADPAIAALTATVTPLMASAGLAVNAGYPEISIISAFHGVPDIMAAAQTTVGNAGTLFGMNFNFLGIDLAAVPTLKFWEGGLSWATIGLFLIPLLSAVFSFLSSKIMMNTNNMNNGGAALEGSAASTNKMMMWMTPIMSLWIGFAMPAGMGIYWIANSVFSVGQELIASKILKKDYAKAAEARAKQAAIDKENEKEHKKQISEERAKRIEENKKPKAKAIGEKKPNNGGGTEASRVGIRAYAKGRAYDPNRYGTPTNYRDPQVINEEAVQKAQEAKDKKKAAKGEQAELAAAQVETEIADVNVSVAEVLTDTAELIDETAADVIDETVPEIIDETEKKDKE
ncbi:MAG: YidC/Oxa1 family membrane protein insertase [Oscillospiraceae bacterium]